jgi:DNA-binding NarL/FixJ family response regulator
VHPSPPPRPGARRVEQLSVAVAGPDSRLVKRIEAALAREGLAATADYVGAGGAGVARLGREPDVVIVDAAAGTRYRSEALTIRRRLPRANVIAVVAVELTEEARRSLYAIVHAVVLESALDTTLGLAVRCARVGQLSFPQHLRRHGELPALSRRERQVLRLVQAGLTNAEIAGRLFLAQSTVKGHLTSAFRQLGVRSRDEVVALILTADEALRRSVLTAPLNDNELASAGETRWN